MKLALALGMTRRQLRANVDSREMTDWIAFDRVDPFGQERADLRAGIIASTISNWKRSPNAERFKPSDFMFEYDPDRQPVEQTPEEVEAAIDAALSSFIPSAQQE